MKKFIGFMVVALFATMTLSLASCKNDSDEPESNDIVGTWKDNTYADMGMIEYLQFKADGTVVEVQVRDNSDLPWVENGAEVYYGKWSRKDNKLTLVINGESTVYTIVKLTSNELGLSVMGFTSYCERVPDSEINKYLK